MGVGANAASAFSAYKLAIGGADNGAGGGTVGGFRTADWDSVALTSDDGIFSNQVVTQGHTVAIPLNRLQQRGMMLEDSYAVSDSGFTTENPGLQPPQQFVPFSGDKIFGTLNDNTIEFHFVLPSSPLNPPARGQFQWRPTNRFGGSFRSSSRSPNCRS